MARPLDLPEFERPPLNEIVLGVQFDAPAGYQQIKAGEVWRLFSEKFPIVEEKQALPPAFETFGLPQQPSINFGFITGAMQNRFWFMTEEGNELLQFQNDRFLHNWRQVEGRTNIYPRFDNIISSFSRELIELEAYFKAIGGDIKIRQCELSYINHIYIPEGALFHSSEWLSYIELDDDVTDFACSFRKTIFEDQQGKRPVGRLICEAASAISQQNRPFVALTFTIRGMPKSTDIPSALAFIENGRDLIVRSFVDATTESAHRFWGRTK